MAEAGSSTEAAASSSTGYLFDELYMWHNPGFVQSHGVIEPVQHWEHVDTKRRLHSLLAVSGLLDKVKHLKPRPASTEELERVHDREYVQRVRDMSADGSKGHHTCGDNATFAPGGYEIAALAAGGAIVATEAVLSGTVRNAYALVRPPGHHAERAEGSGFCIFNNVAVAAAYALEAKGLLRVAIVDYDVHHGNGTQHIFEEDDRVLFISLHQHNNYPPNSGYSHERGKGKGEGFTLNVPLPPGSGSGCYKAAFERVVVPALNGFEPQVILVSCGYDASYQDKLGAMMLSSQDFRWMAEQLMRVADKTCGGKLVMLHEGGYSELYVPFCGLATMEQLAGHRTPVQDPYLAEVQSWGYQDLQAHQEQAIAAAAPGVELVINREASKRAPDPTASKPFSFFNFL